MLASTDLQAQFNRTRISLADFEEADSYLRSYRNRYRDVTKRALLLAAVIAYCRPFKRSHGGNPVRSTERLPIDLSKVLKGNEQILHNHLLELRDRALAHSDFDRKPTRWKQSHPRGFLMRVDLSICFPNASTFVRSVRSVRKWSGSA